MAWLRKHGIPVFFALFVGVGVLVVSVGNVEAQTNTCTGNCPSGYSCSCKKYSSCATNNQVSAGSAYCAGQLTDGVCCRASEDMCSGTCRTSCQTGETEDTACTASECGGSNKFCKSSTSGSGTTAVKCDTSKFKEYAGVCFPLNTGLSEKSVSDLAINLMKWMLYLFGFLAIIAFVIAGIQYLTAAGNMNQIETAKRNMKFSIVGVIVALAGLVIIIAIDALLKGAAWGG